MPRRLPCALSQLEECVGNGQCSAVVSSCVYSFFQSSPLCKSLLGRSGSRRRCTDWLHFRSCVHPCIQAQLLRQGLVLGSRPTPGLGRAPFSRADSSELSEWPEDHGRENSLGSRLLIFLPSWGESLAFCFLLLSSFNSLE